MEKKTKVTAEDGKQDIFITRIFDLPVDLLFKGYVEPELVAQWMGTEVVKLDARKHGSYQFETKDPLGNKHLFNGTIHEVEPNAKIIRTFEMENTSFPVQLEFIDFEPLSESTSKLTIHIIFRSVVDRDNMLKLPFAYGLNMAHNRLEEIVKILK